MATSIISGDLLFGVGYGPGIMIINELQIMVEYFRVINHLSFR